MAARLRNSWDAVAVLLMLLGAPTAARAQPMVGATIGLSTQRAGASDVPYLGPPFGGTSVASVVMIDVPVASHVSVGGEVSLAGRIDGIQRERVAGSTSAEFVSRHHDTVFSADIKIGTPFDGRIRAAGVAGFGLARRDTDRTGSVGVGFGSTEVIPYQASLSDLVPAAGGGIDVAVQVSPKVAILAVGRAHFLADKDRNPDGVVRRGVSSAVLRAGVGAQVRF